MPNKQSARKYLKQSIKNAALNRARREAIRNALKKTLGAASLEEAKKLVREAQKALDKAAKRGVIKKNTAARKLSRLMHKVNTSIKK